MRGKKAKEIRGALGIKNIEDCPPLMKRIYKRVKRKYSRTPSKQRSGFIEAIRSTINQTNAK